MFTREQYYCQYFGGRAVKFTNLSLRDYVNENKTITLC